MHACTFPFSHGGRYEISKGDSMSQQRTQTDSSQTRKRKKLELKHYKKPSHALIWTISNIQILPL